jgi:aminoglycoside/choline kinase family phosphotransferase
VTNEQRLAALHRFAAAALGRGDVAIERASADASFRSYWRVRTPGAASFIVMDAPPGKEDIGPWLDVARRLRRSGVNAPEVMAEDRAHGFVLMSDLGTSLYLPALTEATADALYRDALDALLAMQVRGDATGLPRYDETRLGAEMELFPEWFLKRHLGLELECDEWERIEVVFRHLIDAALEQPVAFVHRDYHSRNLLITARDNPGVVDFQDAVLGPVTYDLVSLLRDCYIEWPDARVAAWSEGHRQRLRSAGLVEADAARWLRWFDLMGLQRHLKVLGIFCRLCYRDGKQGYLGDLPLVLRYTLRVAVRYPELAPFGDWLRARVGERDLTRTLEAVA